MVLVNILLMSANLKIVMLRKPTGFWKILHEVMVSRHEVIACHFLYDVDISLWLKFGSHTFYRTKVMRKYIL